jgi:hypothetical protein
MVAHPDLVSGTGRSDLAFMRAGRGDWVTKVGADGVQAVASVSRGQAFGIKIIDGNKTALFAATVEALDQLGWLDDAQREELAPWRCGSRGAVGGRRLADEALAVVAPLGRAAHLHLKMFGTCPCARSSSSPSTTFTRSAPAGSASGAGRSRVLVTPVAHQAGQARRAVARCRTPA